MPPKAKFTKEEIIQVGLQIVREKGLQAVTARELGKRLNASARPIFTVFSNMEEVLNAIIEKASQMYVAYITTSQTFTPEFKKVGMMMIQFAIDEPKLYQLLFMQEYEKPMNLQALMVELSDSSAYCVEIIRRDYDLDENQANTIFRQLWLYAHGIAALCATKVCRFNEAEISRMLGEQFMGVMLMVKSKSIDDFYVAPSNVQDAKFKVGDLPIEFNK